jgi:hypothetical protein
MIILVKIINLCIQSLQGQKDSPAYPNALNRSKQSRGFENPVSMSRQRIGSRLLLWAHAYPTCCQHH